jgi:hypothetical protein
MMDKVKQAVSGHSEMIEKGIDQAVAQVNKRTGGKYGDTLTKRAQDVKERARQLDAQRRPSSEPDGDGGMQPPPT